MNNSTKILSFSSSKGGVGRTMTLANCAKIYSKGKKWAGIESSITVLVDLDFNAPGIHYYDFLNDESDKLYQISNYKFHSRQEIQSELDEKKIGVAFFLSRIVNNDEYIKKSQDFLKRMLSNPEVAVKDFQEYVLQELFLQDTYNPIEHLIRLESESIFILPAGSPKQEDYSDTVFKFDWLSFINDQMGLYLVDCMIYAIVKHIKELASFDEKPVRVLLDQQAGISVAAGINRFLADSHVVVGGFNDQNKAGLLALVDNYYKTYETEPWVVLNQYNLRELLFDFNFNEPGISPHDNFKKEDKIQRIDFITALTDEHKGLKDQIFVTEFVNEAVQKEYFHRDDKTSINELTKLIVNIERSYIKTLPAEVNKSTLSKIIFIGERIEHGGRYSGPFAAMHKLLTSHFPNAVIVGLASTHEDIVALSLNGAISIELKKSNKKIFEEISLLPEGIYDVSLSHDSGITLEVEDLDFISYPYYVNQALLDKNYIKELSELEFARQFPVKDSLCGTSCQYYAENIFRWNKYSVNSANNSIIGVPLFFNFQLLAYRRDYFSKLNNLADEFRKKYHRQFSGFNEPDDMIKFANLTFSDLEDEFKSVLLCSNPDNIAMWYEWQSIFSIFYYHETNHLDKITSVEEYADFLIEDAALDATLMYLKLRKETDSTTDMLDQSYDWDELIRNFYLSKNNSLIFVWTDAIPIEDRVKSDFIYQVPPSFHLFEESWLFSITQKKEPNTCREEKIVFMNKYLTPEYQKEYISHGGLPVHRDLLASLDIWRMYPFIPPLWSVYQNSNAKNVLSKRESFKEMFKFGNTIATILDDAKTSLDFKKDEEELICDLKKLISKKLHKISNDE